MINVAVFIFTLFLQACVHSGSNSEILPSEENAGPETFVTAGDGTIATLDLESGGRLEFVDVGDNYVGIVERTPPGMSSVLIPTIEKWAASPLEIYLALKPSSSEVPKTLVTDHKRHVVRDGSPNSPPRQLQIQVPGPETVAPPAIEPFDCVVDPIVGFPWVAYWNDTFEDVTDFHPAEALEVTILTMYPGYHVYAGAGSNRKTYFGVCNVQDAEPTPVTVEVHRWGAVVDFNPAPEPPTVTWQWVVVSGTKTTVEIGENYLFYSGHPQGRFRARITTEDLLKEPLGYAAAWTKSLPIGIGF